MSWKVLKVDQEHRTVSLGNYHNNTLKELPLSAFNFTPMQGDKVDVYEGDGKVMAVLHDGHTEPDTIDEAFARESDTVTVNAAVYALLAFLFGIFGVHHFYAGDNKRGLKYLLLTLIFWWTIAIPIILEVKSIIAAVKVLSQPSVNGMTELHR
ncbi:MAG: TM2 domain-containing protein [Lactimicrobium sp.]|jgi:TM2 domain-containing membrane protein YozV|uniref:TM2 domain-containing protein n=1 Tax=Lactimicrobium sp. TaxID=2563780 RepID=UPI002F356552